MAISIRYEWGGLKGEETKRGIPVLSVGAHHSSPNGRSTRWTRQLYEGGGFECITEDDHFADQMGHKQKQYI